MLNWLSQNHKWLQLGLLGLLLASFLGPWTYEADGVPPPEYCAAPLTLLTPERCVKLVSGAGMFGFVATIFQDLMSGAYRSQPLAPIEFLRAVLIIGIICLPVLPLLVLTWRVLGSFQSPGPAGQSSLRSRIVLYVSLGLGWFAALLPMLFNWPPRPYLFWGLWLYLIANDAALMLEVSLPGQRPQRPAISLRLIDSDRNG